MHIPTKPDKQPDGALASILLVDDDLVLLDIISGMLSSFGYRVVTAGNGEEAVAVLQGDVFQLVITDMVMPKMDGMELLQHILKHHPDYDVIVATGFIQEYSYSDIIGAGAADYIVKPISKEELKAKLDRIFRERNLIRSYKKENHDRKLAETALQENLHTLHERVKELDCLYGISSLEHQRFLSIEGMLEQMLEIIPKAWEYPEITCAMIEYFGQKFQTRNFVETSWQQESNIFINERPAGRIKVCYLEKRPRRDEGPFLQEERNLLDAIAERLGKIAERYLAEEALQKSHDELELRVAERTRELAIHNLELLGEIKERKVVEEQLRRSEEKFRSLYYSMNEGVCLHEVIRDDSGKAIDYRITDVNPAYQLITGISWEEAAGSKASELYGTGEAPYLDIFAHVASTGKPVSFEALFPRIQKHFYISVFSPGERKFTIVLSDISDRKQAEEELKKSSEKIKLFAYSVVHDLKNPAISVEGLARVLSKKFEKHGEISSATGREVCEQIRQSSAQIVELVDKINTFIAAKEVPLTIEKVSLKEIFQVIQEEFCNELNSRRIAWRVPENFPDFIRADRLAMLRVFRNLVDNALKHGGDGLSTIAIMYQETDDLHKLFLFNDGAGINEEDSENIFGVFSRQATSRKVKGAGLGLAIVKEIVEQHAGKIDVEPGRKKGITFRVSIVKNLQLSMPVKTREQESGGNECILLIDDEVKKGAFREDLYYRLQVIPIRVPPLRERKEDIVELSYYFLEEFNLERATTLKFSRPALQLLANYDFPGNIRELRNLIERLSVMVRSPVIEPQDLPVDLKESFPEDDGAVACLADVLARAEKKAILRALGQTRGKKFEAASLLGISRKCLWEKMKLHKIKSPV